MPVAQTAAATAELALDDRPATRRLGARLAALLRPGDFVGLGGALGSGKTTLARDVIEALAGGPVEVPSPTFTLVQTYEVGAISLWHVDLYRIEAPGEVLELGLDDALAGGVLLVEWPERLGSLLPAERLDLTLVQGPADDARVARLAAHGAWTGRLSLLADG